jgi:N-methylhydantoinase B
VREDVLRLLLANMRVPRDREGDFRAQLAGAARAERRLQEAAARHGAGTLAEAMAATQAHSALLVRRRLAALPDAEVEHAERLDGDGVDPGARPLVRVRIAKRGEEFAVDFTGSDPCVRGPVNAPLAVTASAVYYVLLGLAGGGVAPNEGVYGLAGIVAPAGTVVNATPPAPVVAANTETSNRLADIMLAALAKAYPERVPAGSYGSACVYTLGGRTEGGRPFVHYETIGGGMGGSAAAPGAGGIRVHMGNTMNLPVEAIEAAVPVRFLRYGLARGSGGAGRHRGGDGVRKEFEVLAERVEASILTERTETPALGVGGGAPGATARVTLRRAGGEAVALGAKSGPHLLHRGDRIEMLTAGGGGWGTPEDEGGGA